VNLATLLNEKSPELLIGGNYSFGECVYFRTISTVIQEVKVCINVIISIGEIFVKEIITEGGYIGKSLKNRITT